MRIARFVETFSPANREWLEQEFFDMPASRKNLLFVAEHYEDIAQNNVVGKADDRKEWRRRAKYLRWLAVKLRIEAA